jgi:7-keto-8-aminopelargonate synthetase-like enzyme
VLASTHAKDRQRSRNRRIFFTSSLAADDVWTAETAEEIKPPRRQETPRKKENKERKRKSEIERERERERERVN